MQYSSFSATTASSPTPALPMPPPTPGGATVTTAGLSTEAPSTIASPPPATPGSTGSATGIRWADDIGSVTHKAASGAATTTSHVTAGATKMVGWTTKHMETATHARGLRPMHVRVSVRVHHVAFLHPGLDNGGRATIGGRAGKWRFAKDKKASPPGLLQFGKKKGDWKNPMSPKGRLSKSKDDGAGDAMRKTNLEREDAAAADASEISEIISAEAFRLSRDGIIQHHYALNQAVARPPPPPASPSAHKFASSMKSSMYGASSRGLVGGRPRYDPSAPHNIHSSMLSAYSSANPQDAARYYKECAERPKGYRRLVVSSAARTGDATVPPPPTVAGAYKSPCYAAVGGGGGGVGEKLSTKKQHPHRIKKERRTSSDHSWHFESSVDLGGDAEEEKKNEEKNENLFNNVEYQYIGPPQTGPEFFQLLRAHGAATFGRYLSELACSVPNHAIGFELRKHSKSRRRCASTQPLVVEAPHVVWGDARDKMLSKIAKEGCPLIDSREFEYVTNAALDDTELSESLMVCGATLWVENAPEDDVLSPSKLRPHYTKNMVKAEYYGGKIVDGITEGLGVGAKGLARGTKKTGHVAKKVTTKTVHGLEKGTKEVVKGTREVAHAVKEGAKKGAHGGKKLTRVSKEKHLAPLASSDGDRAPSPAPSEGGLTKRHSGRKRDKLKSMLNPKKVGDKLRRRSNDRRSIDSSGYSELGDDDHGSVGGESFYSLGGESAATDSAHAVADVMEKSVADEDCDATSVGEVVQTPKNQKNETLTEEESNNKTSKDDSEDFTVIQPVPYVLLLDDVIDIRIVSFPDKNDVIAEFPISVASVMVQRSIDDRISDPLKPSELTATLIQEPNAQELRWGVELKVTLRAVEVHPNIPKVVPRTKDVIDEEMSKMKERLKLLGKMPEEISKDIKAKEEEIVKEENDLNQAIVAYGYGKGENQGAGQSEVRHRQMFYCDRERGAIKRKMKRRSSLTKSERHLINDAMMDPSPMKRDYDKEDEQKMLDLIDLNFPGIGREDAGNGLSINTGSAAGISTSTGSVVASTKKDFSSANNTLAKASLAMAQSLDNCLGDLADKPTVPAVERRLCRTFTEGMVSQTVTRSAAKQWCNQVAEKVSRVGATDAPIKSSIAKIQSIIAQSALGSGTDLEDSIHDADDKMKMSEDETASRTKSSNSETNEHDSSKLTEWINAVSSQLEACAEELDDLESLAHSETFDSIAQVDEEKTASSIGGSPDPMGASTGPSSSRFGGGIAASRLMTDEQSQQTPSVGSPDPVGESTGPSYSLFGGGMAASRLMTDEQSQQTPSVGSPDPVGASTGPSSSLFGGGIADSALMKNEQSQQTSSIESTRKVNPDGARWDSASSRKEMSMSVKQPPSSSLKFQNATSIASPSTSRYWGFADSGLTINEQLQQTPTVESTEKFDPDAALWDSVLSRKETSKSVKHPSSSSLRFRSATSISTVRKALPRSQLKRTKSPTESVLKESHGQTHHVNMRTTSLSATLVYLSIVLSLFALGLVAVLQFFQAIWSLLKG